MASKTASSKILKKNLLNPNGNILLYLIAAIFLTGSLGAAIVSLTTTSTLGELSFNTSGQARHAAQSGLDYAQSALEADDPGLRSRFRSGSIDETIFNLDSGRFILTVQEDSEEDGLYHITSEGRAQVDTPGETGFLVTGEYQVSGNGGGPPGGGPINFSDHNIEITYFLPATGYIIQEDTPENPGYTYDGEDLVLYDDQGTELVTITTGETLRYSGWYGSLGTEYSFVDGGGLLGQDDRLEFTFPDDPDYTELTLYFSSFDPGDRAEVQLISDNTVVDTHNLNTSDITDSSATLTSSEPFDSFAITNISSGQNKRFGLTGINIQ